METGWNTVRGGLLFVARRKLRATTASLQREIAAREVIRCPMNGGEGAQITVEGPADGYVNDSVMAERGGFEPPVEL